MKSRVSGEQWSAFVAHANARYKADFIRAFLPECVILSCAGTAHGKPCPHVFRVDLFAPDAGDRLGQLEFDHEHRVSETSSKWLSALPLNPLSWDDGIDAGDLCHSLFAVRDSISFGKARMAFRCGRKRVGGKCLPYAEHPYCHTK